MATTATRSQGKTGFVKEYLNDHPTANPKAVNDAWIKAGMEGSISASLVNKLRAHLGYTGNLRSTSKSSKAGKKVGKKKSTAANSINVGPETEPQQRRRGRPAKVKALGAETTSPKSNRQTQIAVIEAGLDRLLFQVMSAGQMPRVEEALREVRRILYKNYV